MSLEEIRIAYPDVWLAYTRRQDLQWPAGESGAGAQERIAEFLDAQAARAGNAVAFAHDAILRVLVCHLLGMPVCRLYEFGIDFAGIIEVERGVDWQKWRLVRFNQIVA